MRFRVLGALAILALSLVTPLGAEAQQPGGIPKVGVLGAGVGAPAIRDAFEQTLQGLGWTIGRSVLIDERYSGGRQETLPKLAAEFVASGVDVLVAWSAAGALAAKRSTNRIPVVFLAVGDPVRFGLVASLAHPGGNVTGVSFDAALETYPKGLQLLKEGVPGIMRVALLAAEDPRTAAGRQLMQDAARTLNLELFEVEVRTPADVPAAVRRAKDQGAQALYIWPSGLTLVAAKQLADSALANRLPSFHTFTDGTLAGGLFSYAPSLTDIARRGATYVDRILKGAKPADLPVEQPTKLEFVVNAKTAKMLAVTIPPSVLLRADEVIP